MEIAGRGGVQQNRPRNIAVVFLPVFLLLGPANETGIDKEVHCQSFHDLRVNIPDHVQDVGVVRVVGILHGLPNRLTLGFKFAAGKFVGPVHQLQQVIFRVFVEVVKSLFQPQFFDRICNTHVCSSFLSIPIFQ